MRMTQAYGANGSKYDEAGRCMEPKEVYSRNEHFVDYAQSGSRHFSESLFFGYLVPEFVKANGRRPTKAYTQAPKSSVTSQGRTVEGIGFVMLDIIPGQDRDYVE